MNGLVRNYKTANFIQNVIFIAAHSNSINDIYRYIFNKQLTIFGFTLDIHCFRRTGNNNFIAIFNENLIVFYTAHK
jgi:hypothetical protein